MRHLKHTPLVAPAHHKAPVETEPDALDRARQVRKRALADPVRGVVEGDEGVGAADCEVAGGGGEGEGEAGGGVGVQGVEGLEGRVGGYGYGAVAAGEEEVGGRGGVGEGALVCLEGRGVGGLGGWGGVGGDGDEGVVLVGWGGCMSAGWREGIRRWRGRKKGLWLGRIYLSPNHHDAPIRRPCDCQPFAP